MKAFLREVVIVAQDVCQLLAPHRLHGDTGCGPQKLNLRAVQGVPRLQSHSRMAHTALDISPRSRHNTSVES